MNISYNNDFESNRRYNSERDLSFGKMIIDFIVAIFYIVCDTVYSIAHNESLILVLKVAFSLSCLGGLFVIVLFIDAGTLSAVPGILLALCLLGLVFLCFRGERD